MKIKIEIGTGNEAFSDENLCPEVARILRKLADSIERGGQLEPGDSSRLMDLNGNAVGFSKVTR